MRGTSLPELLVVLLILGLVFALSVPALSDLLAEEGLQTAAREVSAILTTARARAVFQGTEEIGRASCRERV
jgi:prepilin-type N-terminal cleavage/methylation domain